ncbi:MAG: hypothetical protein V7752_08200 [Halopseudomonas sp.]
MPLLELILLVFVLLTVLSIVWTTLQTGISPMMSSGKACQAMLASIDRPADGPLIDLGSGWGTLVIALARKYPRQQVIGYELSWFPWLVSIVRKYSLRLDNLTLYRKDFNNAELSNASILFCYLFPGGMVALHKKLKSELLNKILIVSNTFALPSCQPTKVIRLNDFYRTPIYVYCWRPKLSFTSRKNNDDKSNSKSVEKYLTSHSIRPTKALLRNPFAPVNETLGIQRNLLRK